MASLVRVVAGRTEKYETKWKIQNWMKVQKRKELLESQKRSIDAGDTKWEIGLMAYPTSTKHISVCWKFILGEGIKEELEYIIKVQLCSKSRGNQPNTLFTRCGIIKVGELSTLQLVTSNLHYKMGDHYWSNVVDTDGAIGLLVELTVGTPCPSPSAPPCDSSLVDISTIFFTQNKDNLAAAMNDSSLSDLKIVTSDKKELVTNSFILKVQCPVFASMLNSQFTESSTGIVNVEDISGKTMEILLHFFYTGELLPSWSDDDTIVEFTYAAGKYQMTEVLKMLDNVLGTTDEQETSAFDAQLMNLANKLGLKNAEARLVERVKKMTCNFDSAEQFLALFDNKLSINDGVDSDSGDTICW